MISNTIENKRTAEKTNKIKVSAKKVNKASEKVYNIFLVDDDQMVLKMLNRHFKKFQQYNITNFLTGEECLSALHHKPDIIILDHNLSEHVDQNIMNGFEVLKKIKEQLPKTQVIMLSSQMEVQVAVDCLKKGAINYVVKDATMQFNVQNAIESVVKSIELKEEINQLSQTIKRDKLLMRGYAIVIFALVLALYYLWIQ